MNKKDMNIQEILQEMLSRDPENGNVRNIIFWYDADCEFEQDVKELSFENTKVVVLAENNVFKLKYDIEVLEKESNFLIYAPFEKPDNRENWLLDIQKYSEEFTTDRSIYEMRRLGITDISLKNTIKKSIKFFENEKRVTKLLSFGIDSYITIPLEVGVVSALAKLKAADFDETVRIMMSEYVDGDEKLVIEIDKYSDLEDYYKLIKDRFGYVSEEFKIDEFIATLFYTAFAYEYEEKMPKTLEHLKSLKMSEIVVFVDELLSMERYKNTTLKLSAKYEDAFKLRSLLNEVETELLIDCDTFKLIDQILIERIIHGIESGRKDYDRWIRIAKGRRSRHWYYAYENEYKSIIHALELLKHFDLVLNQLALETVDDYFDMYVEEYHKLDFHYRKFYYYYDQIENKDLLSSLNDYVENVYVSSFLDTLSTNWSSIIERNGSLDVNELKYKKHWNFYRDFVESYVKSDDRIFVIISDAMRYEVASELVTELMKERRAEIDLKALQGTLPSYTKFGMSSLLPRKEMSFDVDSDIKIDDVSTSGTANRQKILQLVKKEAIAVRYDDIKHLKKIDYKNMFTGKKLIYIYHDTIDSYGHKGSPFDAAEIAIEELKALVRSLVNHVSATKIIMTADHGFIYQRSKLEEYDKIPKIKTNAVVETDRRYILSREHADDMNLLSLPLNPFITTEDQLQVVVPKGTIRFKTQGDGGNFVHGGAMLQEIIVPVIEYYDKRSDDFKAKKVGVQLTSITRKLTNRISYLEFFQTESVSEKKLPVNLKIYVTDEDDNRISNEVMIIADRDSSDPKDRNFKEKFVLKDLEYKKQDTYYLVIEDDDETINPVINRYPFVIDLAIINNFGF